MAIGTELDFIVPDERLDGETIAARILPATFITFSGSEIAADAQIGDAVGTLAIASAYQGTPVWELIDSANGRFAVNPSTGVVTVAGSLSAESVSIKAKARGIRPQIFSPTFVIVITDAGGGAYVAKAVHFGGCSLQCESLTAPDSAVFSYVYWLNYDGGTNTSVNPFIVDPFNNFTTNADLTGGGTGGSYNHNAIFADIDNSNQMAGNPAVGPCGTWVCLIVCGKTDLAAGQKKLVIYQGDTKVQSAPDDDASLSFVMSFNGLRLDIGQYGQQAFGGSIALLRLMPGVNLLNESGDDIPLETRRLFIDDNGKPVDPAVANAALGAPAVLIDGDKDTIHNAGTGGVFTFFPGTASLNSQTGFASNGPGSIILTGHAALQSSVVSVHDDTNDLDITSDFETSISVVNHLQQIGAADYSATSITVNLTGTLTNATSPSD